MAVMPMKRISIYALKNRRKQILELIQRRGVVEIDDRKADETVFAKMDTVPAKSRFENNAAALQSALDALDKLEPPEKSLFASLNGRDAIPLSKYQETADGAGELLKIASRINTLWKKCADNRAEILRLQTQIRALEPWMKLDISMRTISTPTTSVFTGSFPVEYTEETLRAKIAEGAPDVDGVVVEILSASPQQTCAFLMCHISQGLKLETYLRSNEIYVSLLEQIPPFAPEAQVIAFSGDGGCILIVEIVLIHDILDDPVFVFIDHKWTSATHCIISQTGRGLVAVLQCFFLHTADHFSR